MLQRHSAFLEERSVTMASYTALWLNSGLGQELGWRVGVSEFESDLRLSVVIKTQDSSNGF